MAGESLEGLAAIQVLHPPRSVRSVVGEPEGDRRATAWESEVVVELVDLATGVLEARSLTQGKLFMALWEGDDTWLDPGRDEPSVPKGARELHQQIEQAGAALRSHWNRAAGSGDRGCHFYFVVDLSSDASRSKARVVEEGLAEQGRVERIDLSPVECGVEEGDRFHPALVVRGLWLPDGSVDGVESTLRMLLYGGARGTSGEEEVSTDASPSDSPRADRFSVARHGRLEAL